jgi:RNA methyltransferase, TrmH family
MKAAPVHTNRIRHVVSPSNPIVKVFRKALTDGVTREGWLGLEGPLLLEEALEAPATATIHCVMAGQTAAAKYQTLLARLSRLAEIVTVSDRMFAQIAATETPQGVAALVEIKPPDLEAVLSQKNVMLLVACGIQDPGNLGTIIRSGQALGADALIALRETVSPFNSKTVRASAGAVLRLPIIRNQQFGPLFERLRRADVRVIGADRRGKKALTEVDLRNSVAFLVGREGSGLPQEIKAASDILLNIPIRDETDSVNAAAAASIFLYEAARQKGFRY